LVIAGDLAPRATPSEGARPCHLILTGSELFKPLMEVALGEVSAMIQLKYPAWQESLRDTILEFDPQKLPPKIRRTEAMIRARRQALSSGAGQTEERQALLDALATIQVLKDAH